MTNHTLSSISDGRWSTSDGNYTESDKKILYGREKETRVLQNAFQRVLENQSSETIVVHGTSGSGKTALVESLRQTVCDSQGYFCSGKYYSNSTVQEPHSAIMAAFSEVCDRVIQSDDYDEHRRTYIQQTLGSDGRLLSKAITRLSPILADEDPPPDGGNTIIHTRNETACAKFKAACKSFLRTMSSIQHPIVLFLDDVHWMDVESRQLIDLFHLDKELSNVLLIVSYIDGEASSLRGMSVMDKKSGSVDIQLSNLDTKAIQEMLSVGMGCNSERVLELSKLVASTTRGNPFHVVQSIDALGREGLLTFDPVSSAWLFDVKKIQKAMKIDDTVIDLLSRKVRHLDPSAFETLKIAAFLGYAFDRSILFEVSCTLAQEVQSRSHAGPASSVEDCTKAVTQSITEALYGSFIEKTKAGYHFRHDRLQSYFCSLLDDKDKEGLNLIVGLTFLASDRVDSIYHATVHLNRSSSYINDNQQRFKLARINLEASKYCDGKSAFTHAAAFLRKGLSLINSSAKWTDHFNLAFEMTESLARLELINGNIEACRQLTREALLHGKSIEMKTDSLMLEVKVAFLQQERITQTENDDSFDTADRTLKVLGINIPGKVSSRHVLLKLLKVRRLLALKKDKDILCLPAMTDRLKATAVKVLFQVYSYNMLREQGHRYVYAALVATELTLRWGTSPFCACAFAIYGIAELSIGHQKRAVRFGMLALKLQDQIRCRDTECPAVTLSLSLLLHWQQPIREIRDPINDAFRCGYQTGDKCYCSYAALLGFGLGFYLGDNLSKLEDYMRFTYQQIGGLEEAEFFALWLKPVYQFVLNLQNQEVSCWRDATMLTGEIMNEKEYMCMVVGARNPMMMMLAWICKAMLGYYFGYYSMAESTYHDMDSIAHSFRYTLSSPPYYLFGALAFYERYRETGQRRHLKQARKYKKLLQQIKRHGSPNVAAYMTLLDAVEASLQARSSTATLFSKFNDAIDAMVAEDWPHMEALANELAGFAFVEKKALFEAEGYFARALELYEHKWGAHAKCRWLREKSRQALAGWRTQGNAKSNQKLLSDIIEVSCEDASHEI